MPVVCFCSHTFVCDCVLCVGAWTTVTPPLVCAWHLRFFLCRCSWHLVCARAGANLAGFRCTCSLTHSLTLSAKLVRFCCTCSCQLVRFRAIFFCGCIPQQSSTASAHYPPHQHLLPHKARFASDSLQIPYHIKQSQTANLPTANSLMQAIIGGHPFCQITGHIIYLQKVNSFSVHSFPITSKEISPFSWN
jgi:hypothetical protein